MIPYKSRPGAASPPPRGDVRRGRGVPEAGLLIMSLHAAIQPYLA